MNNRSVKVILLVTTILFFLGIGWAIFTTVTGDDKNAGNNQTPTPVNDKKPANSDDKKTAKVPKKPARQKPSAVSPNKLQTKTYQEYYYYIEYYDVEVSASASASASAGNGSAYAEAHAE